MPYSWPMGLTHSDFICHIVLAKYVAVNEPSLLRLGKVYSANRQNGIAVVDFAVLCEEADKALI